MSKIVHLDLFLQLTTLAPVRQSDASTAAAGGGGDAP